MKKRTNEEQAKAPEIKPGDHVMYDGAEWEVVELWSSKKYAVIFGTGGRFSVRTEDLKKLEG